MDSLPSEPLREQPGEPIYTPWLSNLMSRNLSSKNTSIRAEEHEDTCTADLIKYSYKSGFAKLETTSMSTSRWEDTKILA